jgi:serine/threonine protein kinase
MNQDVLIEALVQTARKRRILGRVPSERLGDFARQKGVRNLDDVRKWLDTGDGLSAPLAGQIKAFLPKPEDASYGPYIPLAHLADGGMGTVWLACNPKNELVVVKTLRSNLTQQPNSTQGTEFMRRFEREARITQQLTHQSVVRCLDNGVRPDGTAFMVLEYVDSGDLKDLVESRGGLSEGLALAIFHQVVDALTEANRIHLVHRDIKPANIFVASTGRAKLADFGIARSTEQNRTMLTMEGAIVGSPMYMSPEQIVSDPQLDIRSDIYALGAVLYYTLAAKPPYEGRIQEVLHKHCTASIPDIRALRPAISERTAALIVGCMQKERAKRYKEPAELLLAVADALVRLGLTPGGPIEEDTRPGDLSDAESGFQPAVGAITVDTSADRTIAADLSAGARGGTQVLDAHTIVANLLAEQGEETSREPAPGGTMTHDATAATMVARLDSGGDASATMAADLSRGDATSATMAGVGVPGTGVEGDLAKALTADWVTLVAATPGDPTQVMLYARTKLVLGKLREPPVDLSARNYPVMVHKDACQRVSRQHLALRYDAILGTCVLEDLNAANGTMLDGIAVKAGVPCPLEGGRDNIVVLAGTVSLWLRCIRRQSPVVRELAGAAAAAQTPAAGIDVPHALDAVVLSRPENRPELSYAMVLRRLTIGGPGSELACAGSRSHGAIEVGLFAGRWLWRTAGTVAPWKPLAEGTEVDVGGRKLIARTGEYGHFD